MLSQNTINAFGSQQAIAKRARPDRHIGRELTAVLAAAHAHIDLSIDLQSPERIIQGALKPGPAEWATIHAATEIDAPGLFASIHAKILLVPFLRAIYLH